MIGRLWSSNEIHKKGLDEEAFKQLEVRRNIVFVVRGLVKAKRAMYLGCVAKLGVEFPPSLCY